MDLPPPIRIQIPKQRRSAIWHSMNPRKSSKPDPPGRTDQVDKKNTLLRTLTPTDVVYCIAPPEIFTFVFSPRMFVQIYWQLHCPVLVMPETCSK